MKSRIALVTLLILGAKAALAEIRLDFEGLPAEVSGLPGSTREFVAYATIITTEEGEADTSWSLSMTADGGKIMQLLQKKLNEKK